MSHPSSTKANSPTKTRAPRPILVALCLALGLAAAGYSLWSWHQSARPGRTFYEQGLDAASNRQFGRAVDA